MLACPKCQTLGNTLGGVKVKTQNNTLAKNLAKANVKTLGETLEDFDCEALLDILAHTLALAKTDAHRNTLGHVQKKALIKTLAVALEQVKPKQLAGNLVMCRPRQTLGVSLSHLKTHDLAETMADTLAEVKCYILLPYSTLRNCRATASDIGRNSLAQEKVKIVCTN